MDKKHAINAKPSVFPLFLISTEKTIIRRPSPRSKSISEINGLDYNQLSRFRTYRVIGRLITRGVFSAPQTMRTDCRKLLT